MLEHERLQEVYVPGRGNCFPLAFSCAMAAAGKNCAWEETREAAAFGHETHKAKTVQGGRIWADYVLDENESAHTGNMTTREWCTELGEPEAFAKVTEYCATKVLLESEWFNNCDVHMVAVMQNVQIKVWQLHARGRRQVLGAHVREQHGSARVRPSSARA
jgi:hypothetical protein